MHLKRLDSLDIVGLNSFRFKLTSGIVIPCDLGVDRSLMSSSKYANIVPSTHMQIPSTLLLDVLMKSIVMFPAIDIQDMAHALQWRVYRA